MKHETQRVPEHAIALDGVSLSVGDKCIIDSISLTLKPGEMTALLGANGAGKTTLIKCLIGILKPQAGHITILDSPIQSYSRTALARAIAYVPQLLEAKIDFTVLEFVMMSRYAHQSGFGYNDPTGVAIATQSLKKVEMQSFSKRTMHTLSGGERQKVCIAAALAQQSPILVLDEPTAHLDPHQRDEIHSLLVHVAQQEKLSVLAVTHDLNWASMDFDSIYGMKNGQIILSGSVDTALNQKSLHKLFGVNFTLVPHPVTQRPMVVPSARKFT